MALHSRGVTAGSMRGYGTLQTMTALEVLVDEVATALPLEGSQGIGGSQIVRTVRRRLIPDPQHQHAA